MKSLIPKKSRHWSLKYLVLVSKLLGLEIFPLYFFKQYHLLYPNFWCQFGSRYRYRHSLDIQMVSVPVSKKLIPEKSRNRSRKSLVQKKVPEPVSFWFLGLFTHWWQLDIIDSSAPVCLRDWQLLARRQIGADGSIMSITLLTPPPLTLSYSLDWHLKGRRQYIWQENGNRFYTFDD